MTVLSGGREERCGGQLVTSVTGADLGGLRLAAAGEREIAATAEIRATPAATRTPMAMALTKALCAAATSSLPGAPPDAAAASAAATRAGRDVDDQAGACRAASTWVSRER